ncbi:hypothetical protein H6P81_014344 [Aristolochia fimbriata]|uniref:RWP-RK domain-containing protein n=1 Tax=Aristolochia fimbriata TaxID=158543 RepID=A0AAV7EKK0_ARIFI|nr:hypothetical protein H6P81_014344 [Aristolochia fimbriata]
MDPADHFPSDVKMEISSPSLASFRSHETASSILSNAERSLVPAESFSLWEQSLDFPLMDPFDQYTWNDLFFMDSFAPTPLKVEYEFGHLSTDFTSLWDNIDQGADFSSNCQNNVLVGAASSPCVSSTENNSRRLDRGESERGRGCNSEETVPVLSESSSREVVVQDRPPEGIRWRSSNALDFEEISKYFYVPITQAAKELKVGLTVLKKRCRELGISRWPHRKMKSLNSLIHNVQRSSCVPGEVIVRTEEIERLEKYKKLMEKRPELQLTEETKKLRQACFKANYKKRRLMAISACP